MAAALRLRNLREALAIKSQNLHPYYKQGKTLMFKKSEIDKWLLRTRVKDNTELMEEAQRYCATHPLGSRRR